MNTGNGQSGTSAGQSASASGEGATAQSQSGVGQSQGGEAAVSDGQQTGESAPQTWDGRVKQYLSGVYEGESFDTPEAIESAWNRYQSESADQRKNYQESVEGSKKFNEVISKDPRFASMVHQMMQGDSFYKAAISQYGKDAFSVQEGDDGYDDFMAGEQSYNERQNQQKQHLETLNQNREKAKETLTTWTKDIFGENQEQASEFLGWMDNTLVQVLNSDLSPDILTKLYQGFIYDTKVAEAAQQGEVKGRNQNISAQMEAGDKNPLPNLQSSESKSDPMNILGIQKKQQILL